MSGTTAQGRWLFTWLVVLTPITTIIVLMRFWAAWLMKRRVAADDGLVVFAYMNMIVDAGFMIWAIFDGGLGKHSTALTETDITILNKLIFTSSVVWTLGNASAKLSVLLLYKRIFVAKNFERALYIVIGLIVVYGITFLAIFISHCHPVSYFWNPQPGGSCREISDEELASTSLSLVLDLIIILLPMPMLWRLQMTVYKRIALSIMFSIGLITIGVMCWRIYVTTESFHPSFDFYYGLPTLALIVMLELWLSVIVACVPTLAPLMRIYVKPVVSKLSIRSTTGLINPSPAHAVETIGAKRSRKKYYELGGSQDPLSTRTDGLAAAECTYDPSTPAILESGAVHVQKDVELSMM